MKPTKPMLALLTLARDAAKNCPPDCDGATCDGWIAVESNGQSATAYALDRQGLAQYDQFRPTGHPKRLGAVHWTKDAT